MRLGSCILLPPQIMSKSSRPESGGRVYVSGGIWGYHTLTFYLQSHKRKGVWGVFQRKRKHQVPLTLTRKQALVKESNEARKSWLE